MTLVVFMLNGWNLVLQELRRSLDFFRSSGKFSIATMNRGGEKEYFLCNGCNELYIPPTANLTLKGFAVGGVPLVPLHIHSSGLQALFSFCLIISVSTLAHT